MGRRCGEVVDRENLNEIKRDKEVGRTVDDWTSCDGRSEEEEGGK
jgi:hypothetical protein